MLMLGYAVGCEGKEKSILISPFLCIARIGIDTDPDSADANKSGKRA